MTERTMGLKVNLIVALDSLTGKAYLSLTQVNTESNVMCMFLSRLSQKLTEEYGRGWKESTTLLLDGAA